MVMILPALPAAVLVLVNDNSILLVAPIQTFKSPLIPFFLLYSTNAQEILAGLSAHHLSTAATLVQAAISSCARPP